MLPYLGELEAVKQLGAEETLDTVCIGGVPYHQMVFSWVESLLKLHSSDTPLFLYAHLQAAHGTVKHLPGMDAALRDHLVRVLRSHPDLIVLLASDHGMVSVPCDQKMPLLHMLVPRSLTARYPSISLALQRNVRELVTTWDLFWTLLQLAAGGLGESDGELQRLDQLRHQGVDEVLLAPAKPFQETSSIKLSSAVSPQSLFTRLPTARRCPQAGIAVQHCSVIRATPRRVRCDGSALATQPVINDAGAAEEVAAVSEAAKSICEVVKLAMMRAVMAWFAETLTRLDPEGRCARLTLGQLMHVDSDGRGSRYSLRFEAQEGRPQRGVFDIVFEALLWHSVRIVSVSQVTRYKKYEGCAPPGVPPEVCICSQWQLL
eukprot:TRINITY_DN34486_c0_g2_i1.p1 TRINITY_DN34486_c0_g2~~TRINITY_DN34486_c0_g2_i1.p1  ORF type:complete len:375 (-),score=66.23 TRINITY_DN34486_c0_g2_i1:324-1448(-)